MGHQLNIMSRLIEQVATNALSTGVNCLQSSAGGPLCLTMLAAQMNDVGTTSQRTTTFVVNDDQLEVKLAGRMLLRHGAETVSVTRDEFEGILIEHFSRRLVVQPIDPRQWAVFRRKLETVLQRSTQTGRPSRVPETGVGHRPW